MNNKLTRYKLSELIEVTRGQSLAGEYYAEQGDLMRLTLANFDYQNGGFKEDSQKRDIYYTGTVKPQCLLKKGDIITPLTEQTPGLLGSTARIPISGKYVQSGDIALVKSKEDLLEPSFCYYLLPSSQVKKQLAAGSQQTKIRHTSPDAIKNCIVDIPCLEQQKKIGKLLDSLTDKIDENRKQNDLLEKIAKLIYDYWFIQFDFPDQNGKPYKSSGGVMVFNEIIKREIPIGWQVKKVSEVINPIERGISYSSEDIESTNGTPMINLACFSKLGDYRTGEMKYYSKNVSERYIVHPYDMLIACTDMTQGADIIGRPILATEEFDYFTYSTDLAKIVPYNINKMYLYYTLRTNSYHKYIKPFASGTTVKHLNIRGIENYKIIIPTTEIQAKFELLITQLKHKQMLNINEIEKSISLRNVVLPLLLTGQIQL